MFESGKTLPNAAKRGKECSPGIGDVSTTKVRRFDGKTSKVFFDWRNAQLLSQESGELFGLNYGVIRGAYTALHAESTQVVTRRTDPHVLLKIHFLRQAYFRIHASSVL